MKTQTRGICQCCGREQAVVGGRMAKHGYTVKNGWFEGACSGHCFAPMQVDRGATDALIADVEKQVAQLQADFQKVLAGEFPLTHVTRRVRELGKMVTKQIPFADLDSYGQAAAVREYKYKLESRIFAGEDFITVMKELADKYHGTELRVVAAPAATVHIEKGEKRQSVKYVLIARYQDGARVYWTTENGLQGWTGSKAWRALPLVEGGASAN